MKKYTINRPEYMTGIDKARYNPRVILVCLIALAIYMAYNIVATIFGSIYVGIKIVNDASVLSGSFFDIFNNLLGAILSPEFILIMLFSMILLTAFVIIQTRAIDRRKLRTIGLVKKGFIVKYIVGAAVGALLLLILLVPTLITELENVSFIGFNSMVLVFFFAFIIQTAAEELLFRGYLFSASSRRIGIFWAAIVSSAVFMLLHVLNFNVSLTSLLQIFLLGVFFCFFAVRTNSIFGAFGIHFAWNFLQGTIAPLNVSGVIVDYRIFDFKGVVFDPEVTNIIGRPVDLIPAGLLIIAIVLVLFAGKKRLVVKRLAIKEEPENLLP